MLEHLNCFQDITKDNIKFISEVHAEYFWKFSENIFNLLQL